MANLKELPTEIVQIIVKKEATGHYDSYAPWFKDALSWSQLSPNFLYETQIQLFHSPVLDGESKVELFLEGLISAKGRLNDMVKNLSLHGEGRDHTLLSPELEMELGKLASLQTLDSFAMNVDLNSLAKTLTGLELCFCTLRVPTIELSPFRTLKSLKIVATPLNKVSHLFTKSNFPALITLESSFWEMSSFQYLLPQINNYSAYGVEKGEAMKESEQEMIKLAKSNFSLFENLESFMMSTNDSGHIPTILTILPPNIIYFRFVPSSSTGQLGLTRLAKRLAEIQNLPLLKRMYDSKQRSYYGAKKEVKIAKIGEITLGGKVIELETIAY